MHKSGAPINPRSPSGYRDNSPLIAAASGNKEYFDTVQFLLEHDADVHFKNYYGQTAFWASLHYGYLKISQLLFQYGSDINSKDINGNTPLIWAVARSDISAVKFLLTKDVDLLATNAEKENAYKTAVFEAKQSPTPESVQIVDLLESCGAQDYDDFKLSANTKKCYNCRASFKENRLPIRHILALRGKNLMFCSGCLDQIANGIPEGTKEYAIANTQLLMEFYKDIPPRVSTTSLEKILKQLNFFTISSSEQVDYLKVLCSRPSAQAIVEIFGSRKQFLKELQAAAPLSNLERTSLPFVTFEEDNSISEEQMHARFKRILSTLAKHKMFIPCDEAKSMVFSQTHCEKDFRKIVFGVIKRLRSICFACDAPKNILSLLNYFEHLQYKHFNIKDFSDPCISKSIDLSSAYLSNRISNFHDLYEWFIQLRLVVDSEKKYIHNILVNNICHDMLYNTMYYISKKIPFDLIKDANFKEYQFILDIKEKYYAHTPSDFCHFYETDIYFLMEYIFLTSCRVIKQYSFWAIKNNSKYAISAIERLPYELWLNDFEKHLLENNYNVQEIQEKSKSIDIKKLARSSYLYSYNATTFESSPPENFNEHHFSTYLAGIQYNNSDGTSRKSYLLAMPSRGEVSLVREKENPYDKNAVAVYDCDNLLGYVPKEVALNIAKYLDDDFSYTATLFINRFDTRSGHFIKEDNTPPIEYASLSTQLMITISEVKRIKNEIQW